jgi:anti-sigma-K factor RskA
LNVKEYISSGILESYALGELNEAERLNVERDLAQHPELQNELALIEETMEAFFMAAGRKPEAHVKEKILNAVKPQAKIVSMWKYAIAASVIFVLGFVAYNLWNVNRIENNPAFVKVILKGTENAPDAQATVYWNQSTKEVYLRIQSLEALSQDQQYQLWAIVDGKPVDMGVFDNDTGLLKMKTTGKAAAFAVTIEPRGGKASPSLETMQVLGNT